MPAGEGDIGRMSVRSVGRGVVVGTPRWWQKAGLMRLGCSLGCKWRWSLRWWATLAKTMREPGAGGDERFGQRKLATH